jgi:hypothetical protein
MATRLVKDKTGSRTDLLKQLMKTDNELIAEFHGWRHLETPKKQGKGIWNFPEWGKAQWNSHSFLYHKSWDWLMPVVEKIYTENPRAFKITLEIGPMSPLAELHIYDSISEVYDKVVKFIKYHNHTKTNEAKKI